MDNNQINEEQLEKEEVSVMVGHEELSFQYGPNKTIDGIRIHRVHLSAIIPGGYTLSAIFECGLKSTMKKTPNKKISRSEYTVYNFETMTNTSYKDLLANGNLNPEQLKGLSSGVRAINEMAENYMITDVNHILPHTVNGKYVKVPAPRLGLKSEIVKETRRKTIQVCKTEFVSPSTGKVDCSIYSSFKRNTGNGLWENVDLHHESVKQAMQSYDSGMWWHSWSVNSKTIHPEK